jgi:hypothetical protein
VARVFVPAGVTSGHLLEKKVQATAQVMGQATVYRERVTPAIKNGGSEKFFSAAQELLGKPWFRRRRIMRARERIRLLEKLAR